MPKAYGRVESSSEQLVEATRLLKDEPFSQDGRKLLLSGARG